MGKTLGIIGKGKLIQHFFAHLRNSAVHQDERYNAEAFLAEFKQIIFYGHGYETKEDYKKSLAEHKGKDKNGKATAQHLDDLCQGRDCSWDVEMNSTKFLEISNIVVDASKDYRPGDLDGENHRKESLFGYAKSLSDSRVKDSPLEKISAEKDYQAYLDERKSEEVGRKLRSSEEFQQHWESSLKAIHAVVESYKYEYGKDYEEYLGMRMTRTLPFNIEMTLERGKEIQDVLRSGYNQLPTFITLVNEPCMVSNILAGQCPQMAPYLVACAGYDAGRLEIILNSHPAIVGAKKKAGVSENYKLTVDAVFGAHDKKMMIIVPEMINTKERVTTEKIFGYFDAKTLHQFLGEILNDYWKHYNSHSGDVEKRDVNDEVDRCLLKTIICAARSRGKAFSVYPAMEEQPLCNGYFQRSAGENTGMFLMGAHRFINGKVLPEEGR